MNKPTEFIIVVFLDHHGGYRVGLSTPAPAESLGDGYYRATFDVNAELTAVAEVFIDYRLGRAAYGRLPEPRFMFSGDIFTVTHHVEIKPEAKAWNPTAPTSANSNPPKRRWWSKLRLWLGW